MSDSSYKVSKTISGKYVVHYQCPNCKESLKNSIDDAGCLDTCPQCQNSFVVPGAEKKNQLESERQKEEAAALAIEEQEAREREARAHAVRMAKQQKSAKNETLAQRPPYQTAAKSDASNETDLRYPSIEIKIRPTVVELVMQAGALLFFVGVNISYFGRIFSVVTDRRFDSENALGATANAVERGVLLLNICALVLMLILWKLHQLTRIQALAGMQVRLK